MSALHHLADDVKPMLLLPENQRMRQMTADRFISHDRLKPIIQHIDYLRFAPKSSRAEGLVVHGPSGSGKSMLAESVLRRYPSVPATATTPSSRPVIGVEMTDAKEAKHLVIRLLDALEVPHGDRGTRDERERMALRLCVAAGVKLLIVDEIQDILSGTERQQKIALETIKFFMNRLSIPILVLGVEEAKEAMEVDQHLNARFRYRELPLWTEGEYLERFLAALEARLPLKRRSNLKSATLMKHLVSMSGGILDRMVKTITKAGVYAIQTKEEQITKELLTQAWDLPPLIPEEDAMPKLPVAA